MNLILHLLISLALTCCVVAAPAKTSFRTLPEGHSIEVIYVSTGCFHRVCYEVKFRRAASLTADVVQVEQQWDEKQQRQLVTKRIPLGIATLSDTDAAGLDTLMEFYRKRQKGGCTTTESVSVAHRDETALIATESFVDDTGAADTIVGLTMIEDIVNRLLPNPQPLRVPRPDPAIEAKNALAKALQACRELPGYERARSSFTIENALIGCVNGMPLSLFVDLERVDPATVDGVRWWNPLLNDKPEFTWADVLETYNAAEAVLSKHSWLRSWKKLPGKRSVSINLQGRGIGETSTELTAFVLPVWRHAKMRGEPTYCLSARWNQCFVTLYFSDQDDRALVCSASTSLSNSPLPVPQTNPNAQCDLDRLDLSWHPKGKAGEKYSKYAIVGNDGRCEVRTFVAEPW